MLTAFCLYISPPSPAGGLCSCNLTTSKTYAIITTTKNSPSESDGEFLTHKLTPTGKSRYGSIGNNVPKQYALLDSIVPKSLIYQRFFLSQAVGKDEVTSSNLVSSSKKTATRLGGCLFAFVGIRTGDLCAEGALSRDLSLRIRRGGGRLRQSSTSSHLVSSSRKARSSERDFLYLCDFCSKSARFVIC